MTPATTSRCSAVARIMDAIARDGLKISGLLGDRTVTGMKLADDPAQLAGRFGLILCAVKSYDTESIADALADR